MTTANLEATAATSASADNPSGPILYLEEVIGEAIRLQMDAHKYGPNGEWYLPGGCTPATAGTIVDLRWVAEEVFNSLREIRAAVIEKVGGRS